MALGAKRSRVLALVAREAVLMIALGLTLGVVAAMAGIDGNESDFDITLAPGGSFSGQRRTGPNHSLFGRISALPISGGVSGDRQTLTFTVDEVDGGKVSFEETRVVATADQKR